MRSNTNNKEADVWTIISCLVKSSSTLVSDTYFFTLLFSLLFNSHDPMNEKEIPWWDPGLGIAVSIIVTVGDAYCDWIMNRMNQDIPIDDEELTINLIDRDSDETNIALSKSQNFALGCDLIGNITNIAAPFTMLANTVSSAFFGAPLSRTSKAIALATFGLFGTFASVALTRVARTNMLKSNKEEERKRRNLACIN